MEYVLTAIFAFMVIIVIYGLYDKKQQYNKTTRWLKKNWANVPDQEYTSEKMKSIRFFSEKYSDKDNGVDDITWNDLDMDQIYMTVNNTKSAIGEEYLYYLLRNLSFSNDELNERERLIRFFQDTPSQRIEIERIFISMGKLNEISVYEYMNRLHTVKKQNNTKHYLADIAILLSIGLIFVDFPIGLMSTIGFVFYNVFSYFSRKAEIEKYFSVVSYLMRWLKAAERLKKLNILTISDYTDRISLSSEKMKTFKNGGFAVTSIKGNGSLADIFMDYLRLLFHIDLIKFNRMISVFEKNDEALDEMFRTMGFLDSMIAVASFRELIGTYAVPVLEKSMNPFLEAADVFHPMIENPVTNSITCNRCVLLTGSNASGKSTFIKTLGINAILSQTIFTSMSSSYHASFFRVVSSMALQDNLSNQESYYIVEIKSLKRIMDGINEQLPTLCFVDEVLRGTNTLERIAASSRILQSFSQKNTICFAATHDIELTHILENSYDNYHFQEEIVDNDILFDYTLYHGRSTSKNAIKLLEIMGYTSDIIEAARKAAEEFEQTSTWSKLSSNA